MLPLRNQCEPGGNGNEGVLHIPQHSKTGASPWDVNSRTNRDYPNYSIVKQWENWKESKRLEETCCHLDFSERPSQEIITIITILIVIIVSAVMILLPTHYISCYVEICQRGFEENINLIFSITFSFSHNASFLHWVLTWLGYLEESCYIQDNRWRVTLQYPRSPEMQ